MPKFISLFSLIWLVMASPILADNPGESGGTFAVYFVAYNHASNSPQANAALRSVDGGVVPPLGNDGYTLESGSLTDLLSSIWSNQPGNQSTDLKNLGVGSNGLASPQSQPISQLFCGPIESGLKAPNSLADGITFSSISSCAPGRPTVVMTTNGRSSLHVTLTVANNQVQGVLTTPPDVTASQKKANFNPPWADPCVTINFGFTAETDIAVKATGFSVGKWKGSFTGVSSPSDCSPSGEATNFSSDSAPLPGFFTGGGGQALAQSMLDGLPLASTFDADLSAVNTLFKSQVATLRMTPYEWNGDGNFGYFFLQQDPPKDFSGSLKGAVHMDNALAPKLYSCSDFNLKSSTRIGAVLPNTWDHGQSYDDPNVPEFGSYGSVHFATAKPVTGHADSTCSFTMTSLPLGYDTSFVMNGGAVFGTTMSLEVSRDTPLNWSGETIVAANSTGDFQMTVGRGVDVSHHVGTGPNLINAPDVGAVLQQHGGGGDPAQTVVLANRALALNPHDYASLATLAGANFRLGKTSDARTQLTRAISLATSAHDTLSVTKFQAQLKAMGQ